MYVMKSHVRIQLSEMEMGSIVEVARARTMLHSKTLNKKLWAEVVVLNRIDSSPQKN